MSDTPDPEPGFPPLHPGRASAQTLRLIELVLTAPTPAQAVRTLEELRQELRGKWQDDLTLDEASRIDLMLAELDEMIADLHRIAAQRRPLPDPEVLPTEGTGSAGPFGAVESSSEGNLPDLPSPKDEEVFFLGRGVSGFLGRRVADVARLEAGGLPVLASPQDVARALGLSLRQLRWLTFHTETTACAHYVQFVVSKKSGGTRILSAPLPLLAQCQRWVLENILARLPVEEPCHGFVPRRSIVTNAAVHAGQGIVVNLDLEDFFPSIGFPRVRSVFVRAGYSESAATVLALLCTECPRREVAFNGLPLFVATGPRGLPQGACTSPALSNQIARKLDRRLAGLARALGWRYSRYADDLTFSASRQQEGQVGYVLARVRHLALAEGFRVNEKKTRVLRPSTAQVVTGLVVNARPAVPRRELRRLRAILHQAAKQGLEEQNRDGRPHFRAWLRGKIAYVQMVNPLLGAALLKQLQALGGETP